jgi:hypothetical protein
MTSTEQRDVDLRFREDLRFLIAYTIPHPIREFVINNLVDRGWLTDEHSKKCELTDEGRALVDDALARHLAAPGEGEKVVFVAWTNTDLTEGRGAQYPFAVCESRATALRLGAKKSVQGTDCHVSAETAIKQGARWLIPGRIHPATDEDRRADEAATARAAALEKARAAGLSEQDIADLRSAQR